MNTVQVNHTRQLLLLSFSNAVFFSKKIKVWEAEILSQKYNKIVFFFPQICKSSTSLRSKGKLFNINRLISFKNLV